MSAFFCGGGIALNTQMPTYLKDFDDDKGNYDLLWGFVNNKSLRTVIDVGAWWGPWSLWWCKHAERVEIFEPNTKMIPKLQYNIANHPNCHLHKVALGSVNGAVSMDYDTHSGTNHITSTNGTIPLHTLDEYNFQNVDIIKIDVEGYEIPVLEGARQTIIESRPLIQIEANKSGNRYGRTKKDISMFLQDMGMKRLKKQWPDQVWGF